MLSIKRFAELCRCSTQTLRYYDRKGLLKPCFVDEQNGYRFYLETQVIQFQKIKNLQEIDCSLCEMKKALDKEDDALLELIDCKIREFEHRLSLAKTYRQSYQERKMKLEAELTEYLENGSLNIKTKGKNVLFKKADGNEIELCFDGNVLEIVALLQEMQENPVIAIDSEEFLPYVDRKWSGSKIYEGWTNPEGLFAMMNDMETDRYIALHLFCVSEEFSIQDCARIIDYVDRNNTKKNDAMFAIGYSKEKGNRYAILYHD